MFHRILRHPSGQRVVTSSRDDHTSTRDLRLRGRALLLVACKFNGAPRPGQRESLDLNYLCLRVAPRAVLRSHNIVVMPQAL